MSCLSAVSLVVAQSGTNYQTGDGHVRSESVDPQGNVRGQYSYIDPNGKTITVKYSAGKDGFQVIIIHQSSAKKDLHSTVRLWVP